MEIRFRKSLAQERFKSNLIASHWTQGVADVGIFLYKAVYRCVPGKARKKAKIRNRYNQAPHLTQDMDWKVTTSQLDITNESQEVSPFPAGDHKA